MKTGANDDPKAGRGETMRAIEDNSAARERQIM